jgi:hypothetical protein
MSYLIGAFVGGLIAVFVLAYLWEFLLFKRVLDDPVKGNVASVIAGWLTAGTIAGFGMANGGPFAWYAFLIYLVPALVVGTYAVSRGKKTREKIAVAEATD